MRRALAVALALGCAACAGLWPFGDDARRLADWQHKTVSLRGLDFERGVSFRWVSRDELPALLRDEAGAELDPARVTDERDSYAALGALAPDVDLAKETMELYESQLAGLYSPKRNTLFVSDEMRGPLKSFLLDPIVVHELTHALQDQHFPDTLHLMLDLENEDDVVRALSGTVEGDASITMFGALPGGAKAETVEVADQLRDSMLAELSKPDSDIGRAPRLLAVGLVFPYAYGTVAAAHLYERNGNAGLDSALRDPPLSTVQVLNPGIRARIDFIRLPLDELRADPGTAACTQGQANVAGPLTVRVLLEATQKGDALERLVSAWRGDRFVRLDCGDKWELVWLTRWDTAESAQRFAAAYGARAAEIAGRTRLSGPVALTVSGTSALAVTPGLRGRADELLHASEIRGYTDFRAWLADGCFPEQGCPPPSISTSGD
ncbi:MAG TPA: hypothetical protein VEN47_01025 [Myxococcota bacterium]|nr:hypothetical protein [Myxococcota bacterium]